MQISNRQTLLFGEDVLTSLQEVSLVSRSALPGSEKAQKMTGISGRQCYEQFGKFNRATSWVKTFVGLLIGGGEWYSTKCYLTWKMKDTKFSRFFCQLAPSTPRIKGKGFGLLPTPTAIQRDHPERVEALQASGAKTMMSRNLGENRPNSIIDHLNFYKMLPTPSAMEGEKITGLENQDSLTKRARQQTGKTSQLNPRFVLEMMGFPPNWTELPFQNGETSQSKPPETQ